MDKITCLAFLLYSSSKNQDIKEKAIQLLNGEISVRDLKKNNSLKTYIIMAESLLKKNKLDKHQIQQFVEEFMAIEV